MTNAGNNSIAKSSPFDPEYIRCLKLIQEIEKVSSFLKQYYAASELSNSIADLELLTYSIEHAFKAVKEQEGKVSGSLLN